MFKPAALQDSSDVIQTSAFRGNNGASICFVEAGMFVHRQADRCRPVYQRVVRVEMEQIPILAGGAHAQDVLQRLWACLVLRGKVFDLE